MKKIILGSASPRRKELLSQIGVPFEVRVSNKEEVYTNTVPKEIVKELALMKAENVASEIQARNVIVIGADTIVVHEEQILGKPKDEQEAFEMIRSLQGDTHQVYTGVAVLDFDKNGEKHKVRLKGYNSIVVQHEIDHLNGIMFYDHINQEDPFFKPNDLVLL